MSVRHSNQALIDPKQMPVSRPDTAVVELLADAACQRLGISGPLARRLAQEYLDATDHVSEERFFRWIEG